MRIEIIINLDLIGILLLNNILNNLFKFFFFYFSIN